MPPFSLRDRINENGVYHLLNSAGCEAGFVFVTEPMAPLPGFSGPHINVLVTLDRQGQFLNVQLLNPNEPIFVSGPGEAPFHKFFEQYRGHSISATLLIGSLFGAGGADSDLVNLDGVTKATASVQIAHESVMAATPRIAREKMGGVRTGPAAHPDSSLDEDLDWDALIDLGLVTRRSPMARSERIWRGPSGPTSMPRRGPIRRRPISTFRSSISTRRRSRAPRSRPTRTRSFDAFPRSPEPPSRSW